MKVKVGNVIYDSDDEPVMVILTDKDKENISNMAEDAMRYCLYPDTWNVDDILAWMKDVSEFDRLKKLLLEDERIQKELELLFSDSFGDAAICIPRTQLPDNQRRGESVEELHHPVCMGDEHVDFGDVDYHDFKFEPTSTETLRLIVKSVPETKERSFTNAISEGTVSSRRGVYKK